MTKHDIFNVHNLSINNLLNMNNKEIKGLRDGTENGDAVNVGQLNDMETNIAKYVKTEIAKLNTNLKIYFNNQSIAEHGYTNSLICVFYLDNNQFNNGDKIGKLPDKKIPFPSYDANQSEESRKPTVYS